MAARIAALRFHVELAGYSNLGRSRFRFVQYPGGGGRTDSGFDPDPGPGIEPARLTPTQT